MRPEQPYQDDLDYFAQIGLEKAGNVNADLEDLGREMRRRNFFNQKYAAFNAFVLGIFLGVTVFFAWYNRELVYPVYTGKAIVTIPELDLEDNKAELILDTMSVAVADNFNKPAGLTFIVQPADTMPGTDIMQDTAEIVSLTSREVMPEPQKEAVAGNLKFLLNYPVTYIHDLKISDYRRLYFGRRTVDDLGGIPAAFAAAQHASEESSHLRTFASEYLHEELSEAMRCFKSAQYERCMVILNKMLLFNHDDVNADFYLGMCFYHKKNYAAAIACFDQSLDNTNNAFWQEAMFYKALSLQESGSKEQALPLFKQISEEGYFYAEKARVYLSQ